MTVTSVVAVDVAVMATAVLWPTAGNVVGSVATRATSVKIHATRAVPYQLSQAAVVLPRPRGTRLRSDDLFCPSVAWRAKLSVASTGRECVSKNYDKVFQKLSILACER